MLRWVARVQGLVGQGPQKDLGHCSLIDSLCVSTSSPSRCSLSTSDHSNESLFYFTSPVSTFVTCSYALWLIQHLYPPTQQLTICVLFPPLLWALLEVFRNLLMAQPPWIFLVLCPFLVEECIEDTVHRWKPCREGATKIKARPQNAAEEPPPQ